MSHTFKHEKVSFIHNGDYSGDVEIVSNAQRMIVPIDAILDFVAQYVTQEKITRLENCSTDEVLFGDMP